ncbi:MAG: hypothetical protein P8J27_10780 [Mariniblastus sp.]|nr:hypothetical protein [Mariniblastus sp.]
MKNVNKQNLTVFRTIASCLQANVFYEAKPGIWAETKLFRSVASLREFAVTDGYVTERNVVRINALGSTNCLSHGTGTSLFELSGIVKLSCKRKLAT